MHPLAVLNANHQVDAGLLSRNNNIVYNGSIFIPHALRLALYFWLKFV